MVMLLLMKKGRRKGSELEVVEGSRPTPHRPHLRGIGGILTSPHAHLSSLEALNATTCLPATLTFAALLPARDLRVSPTLVYRPSSSSTSPPHPDLPRPHQNAAICTVTRTSTSSLRRR